MKNPIAVSTWSLHRALGYCFHNGPSAAVPFAKEDVWGQGVLTLLDLPAALASHGYFRCEICHFHIGDVSEAGLQALRQAFQKSGVIIQTLLIDDGDVTNVETRDRDLAWIKTWIDVAGAVGAENVRVIAGKTPPSEQAIASSVSALRELITYASKYNLKVVTENWFDLLSTPAAVHQVLEAVGPQLGFMADTGNWGGTTKHADLQSVFARANLCHAKASFDDKQVMDETDFGLCLAAAKASHYAGPLTLIFDGVSDEWQGLKKEKDFIAQY